MMTLIHPVDLLALERLSRSVHYELKLKAPSKSAFFEPDQGNFRDRLRINPTMYGSFASWKRFQKEIFGFASENEYIVVTDIANFFDFINFRHLRNVISSLTKIRESNLDLLINILSKLSWTPDFMPRSDTGMPQIETTATRVLANAMLFELDRVCEAHAVSNYARFMDDIDAGCRSYALAKSFVRDVDLTLQSRQLRLNASKTRILNKKEAFKYFCISENEFLARLTKLIEKSRERIRLRSYLLQVALDKYEEWLDRQPSGGPGEKSPFLVGNGSKIHKWLLSIISDLGGRVPEEDLLWLVRMKPSLRQTAFYHLSYTRRANFVAYEVLKLHRRGIFIDDAAIVFFSHFLLHARFSHTKKLTSALATFVRNIENGGDVQLHCSILISSRFLLPSQLLALLHRNRKRISRDFWLGRLAAGVFPIFLKSPTQLDKFVRFIQLLASEEAAKVMSFHMDLVECNQLSQADKSYLLAKNDKFPQGIYFSKVLIALSYTHGHRTDPLVSKIFEVHPVLKNDPFYRSMGFCTSNSDVH